jgi:hypothetical protein
MVDVMKVDAFVQSSRAWRGYRPIRGIAYMPAQHGNASPASIPIRSTKLTRTVSFWMRIEPPQLILGKALSDCQDRRPYGIRNPQ